MQLKKKNIFADLCFLVDKSAGEGRLIAPTESWRNTRGILLGDIEDVVWSKRVESLPDLRRKITAAIATVPVDVLSRVWGEVEFCFDVCRAVNIAYIEFTESFH
jgi:hypothetical protein